MSYRLSMTPVAPSGAWGDVRPEQLMGGHAFKRQLIASVGRTTQASSTSNDLAFAASQHREEPW